MLHFDPNLQIQHAACKKCILLSYYHIRTQNDPDEYGLYPPACKDSITVNLQNQVRLLEPFA